MAACPMRHSKMNDRCPMEKALTELDQQFQLCFQHMIEAICVVDLDGRIDYVNESLIQLSGYSKNELMGSSVEMLIAPGNRSRHVALREQFPIDGKLRTMNDSQDLHLFSKEERTIPIDISLSPVEFSGKQYLFVFINNITDRKTVEEEQIKGIKREAEKKRLKKELETQEQLIGVIAHELRAPLTALIASSELLLDPDCNDSNIQTKLAEHIYSGASRMANLVNDLLDLSRLNHGLTELNWTEIKLHEIAMNALKDIKAIDSKKLELSCSVEPSRLSMRGNEESIYRLLTNLLGNAQKFTQKGFIKLLMREAMHEDHQIIEITVCDNGDGIRPEIADRLGVPFALNARGTGDRHISGTGLGLSICNGIVAAYGGSMSIQSACQQGTTVIVRLRADLEKGMKEEKPHRIQVKVAA